MKTAKINLTAVIVLILSVSLMASALTAFLTVEFQSRAQFQMLGTICGRILEHQPEAEQAVFLGLKEYKNQVKMPSEQALAENNFDLSDYGYNHFDFAQPLHKRGRIIAALGFLFAVSLLLFAFWYLRRKETLRIKALADYLERANTGNPGLLFEAGEDEYSKLQDEIYKTVTMLYQTKEAALEAKCHFAENLANIAHQLKTPITAVSLSTQMLKSQAYAEAKRTSARGANSESDKAYSLEYLQQIERQLHRLTHLEEALLLLSRVDSGALALKKETVDVFTLLMLAADNLQEVSRQAGVSLIIPEFGEMEITADLDWTMEAVMNLFKNCIEHTPSGKTVVCSCSQNPLYTEICMKDEGSGFAKEDLPHLFERFYRGQNAGKNSIGIGLSLAKELIESQNGTLRAGNHPKGGAYFEIRFYSH